MLVVIGILIALQINTWNIQRIQHQKEISYLNEIRENLLEDIESIKGIKKSNIEKENAIGESFAILSDTLPITQKVMKFMNNINTLVTYSYFESNRVAFDNMLSAENIDLIGDINLRKLLSSHYTYTTGNLTQEQVKLLTRKFVEYFSQSTMSKQLIELQMGVSPDIRNLSELTFDKDPLFFSHLFMMQKNLESHIELIDEIQTNTNQVLQAINTYLK